MYDRNSLKSKAHAIKYATMDSNIQLSIAFIINCLLLVLGAALFYGVNTDQLGGFYDLYHALQNQPILGASMGAIMSTLFAIALLASGQNSTITGTMAGQIVMEGFYTSKFQIGYVDLLHVSLQFYQLYSVSLFLKVMKLKLNNY